MRKRECEGDWAMLGAGTNPAFQRAISHGTVIIDSLLQVLIFGPFRGSISDLIWGSFRSSCWDHFGAHFGPKMGPRRFDLELGNSNLDSNEKSATPARPLIPSLAELPLHSSHIIWQLELEPEPSTWHSSAHSRSDLELQAELSFRCTSSQVS